MDFLHTARGNYLVDARERREFGKAGDCPYSDNMPTRNKAGS